MLSCPVPLPRPGDVLNSSGFRGQLKSAFVAACCRSARRRAPSAAAVTRCGHGRHRLASVHDLPPLARFGGLARHRSARRHQRSRRPSTPRGFWAVVARLRGRVWSARASATYAASRCPRPPRRARWRGPGAATTGRPRWTGPAYIAGVRPRSASTSRPATSTRPTCAGCCPRRCPTRRAPTWTRSTALLARGNPAPYAGTDPAARARRARSPPRRPSSSCAATATDRRVRTDQGHRPHRRGPAGEGPRRERDDRRPGPQRPRPGLRHRLGRRSPTCARVEQHPGLVHLVSTVRGELRAGRGLGRAARAPTFPPGSVTGAPKSSALRIIDELETAPRGPYCGAHRLGRRRPRHRASSPWRSARSGSTAPAAVLRFGTGAGITWGSDPEREWDETELKAARLLAVASAGSCRRREGTLR